MSHRKEKNKKKQPHSSKPSLTVIPSREGSSASANPHPPVSSKRKNATAHAGVARTGLQATVNTAPITEVVDQPEPMGFPKLIQALELFRDQQNQPCVVLKDDPNRDVFYIGTKPFKQLLEGLFYDEYGKIPSKATLADGIRLSELLSSREKIKHTVWQRFAHVNGTIYIDMCDNNGSVIVVTEDGYSIKKSMETDIYFHRNPISDSLPIPIPGGDYMSMFNNMNIKHRHDLCLVATWPIVAAIHGIPRPPLVIYGLQGSAKSTAAMMLKNLIAPDVDGIVKIKSNEAEMAQIIHNHAIPSFDNVNIVSQNIADLLCMTVTGGNYTKRKLYTDNGSVIFDLQKPIITSSINIWTNAPDLLDRCLFVELEQIKIPDEGYSTSVVDSYNENRGRFLDGYLHALSKTLKLHKDIQVDNLPRMAHYYKWAYAASLALGFEKNEFIEAYRQSRLKGQLHSLDQDGFGRIFVKFLDFIGPQEMSSSLFHTKFLEFAKKLNISMNNLPKAANALSKKIHHMSFALQPFGWSVTLKKARDANMVCIKRNDT